MKCFYVYKFFIISLFVLLISCNDSSVSSRKVIKNKVSSEIPILLKRFEFVETGKLYAYVVIDGDVDNKKSMNIDFDYNGTASAEFTDLSLAPHTAMVYYEYKINKNSFLLASAYKNIDLSSGPGDLIFTKNEFDLDSFDNNGDGNNNAQELVIGKIPVLNNDTISPVFSVDDRTSISVIEGETETNYTANASDESGNVTYRLVGGIDIDKFEIHPETGALKFIQPPNFKEPNDANEDNAYLLGILVTDGVNQAVKNLTVNVIYADKGVGPDLANILK